MRKVTKRSRPKSAIEKDSGVAQLADVLRIATGLLARREHSRAELTHKLAARGFEGDLVSDALDQLFQQGLLSDARFAESYVHVRCERGFGPLRIRNELRERGVDAALIDAALEVEGVDWRALVVRVRAKRFGQALPNDFKERARQTRFLQQRGFTAEQIHAVVAGDME